MMGKIAEFRQSTRRRKIAKRGSRNTMKNTAARVGPIGVQGAIACPRERRRRRAPSKATAVPPHPVRDKKCHTSGGQKEPAERGKPCEGANMGKPAKRGDGMLKAVAERNPRSDTAVPSEARAGAPTQEGRPRAPWRGGRSRRRSPTRATAEPGPPTDKGRETAGNGP